MATKDEANKAAAAQAAAANDREVLAEAAALYEQELVEERKRHEALKRRPRCPFRAGYSWPHDRCLGQAGGEGCALWVDRGGWAKGCALSVAAVALARGLTVTSYNLEP